MNIRRLDVGDAGLLMALRREALETDPLAFAASPNDDVALVTDSVQRFLGTDDDQAVFGRFERDALVGMIGLGRAARLKQRHKANIWGMYVQSNWRKRGIGRALLAAAIEQARAWGIDQLHLSVTDAAPAAQRLYEASGFRTWGLERRALCWNGRFVNEHHFALDLSNSQ